MGYEKLAEKGGLCPEGCVRCCTYGPDIDWKSELFKKTVKKLQKKGKDVRVFFTQSEWETLQKELDENEYISIDKEYCVFADKDGVFGYRGCLIHDQKRPWICGAFNGSNELKCTLYEQTMRLAQIGVLDPLLTKQLPYESYTKLLDLLEQTVVDKSALVKLQGNPIHTVEDALQFISSREDSSDRTGPCSDPVS